MKKYVVTQPVADLRREPSLHKDDYSKDTLQETQLLFGELLMGTDEKDGWAFVEAIEQSCFKDGWRGYPGWVKTDKLKAVHEPLNKQLVVQQGKTLLSVDDIKLTLSLGTKLTLQNEQADVWQVRLEDGRIGVVKKENAIEIDQIQSLNEKPKRKRILEIGKTLLGSPYLWGGRSSYDPDNRQVMTSVDCSGLVSLLYRVSHGIDIPRDAHDQFLKCDKCKPSELNIGDLIFFSSASLPNRINHVMIYAGFDEVLEATEQTRSVQVTSLKEKVGHSLKELSSEMKVSIKSSKRVEEYILFFGKIVI